MESGLLYELILGVMGLVFLILNGLIAKALIPWLVEKCGLVKVQKALVFSDIAVKGMEEFYKKGVEQGVFKKMDALAYLKDLNLGFTDEQLSVLIDKTVAEMNEVKEVISNSL